MQEKKPKAGREEAPEKEFELFSPGPISRLMAMKLTGGVPDPKDKTEEAELFSPGFSQSLSMMRDKWPEMETENVPLAPKDETNL